MQIHPSPPLRQGRSARIPLTVPTVARRMLRLIGLALIGAIASTRIGLSRPIARMSQTVPELPVRIVCFNCAKSALSVETILKRCNNMYNVLFIQKPPWRIVRTAPSTISKKGDDVIGTPLHSAWLPIVHLPEPGTRPRVMAYVSNRLSVYHPSMRRDLINHCNVLILTLFSHGESYNLMNVYSDNTHTAINHLKGMAPDLGFTGHLASATDLTSLAAEIGLQRASFVNPGPTHFPRIVGNRASVIDLVFVPPNQLLTSQAFRVHDYIGECIDAELPLETPDQIDAVAQAVVDILSSAWDSCSREVTIVRRSKKWWNNSCAVALQLWRATGTPEDWKTFCKACKDAKRKFFNTRISEISEVNKRA
uniref:Uncharacterized protein n=1 Tax=Psilocybe cubensis TaxID=181762 RepID=A0A8H7XYV7_PSICU